MNRADAPHPIRHVATFVGAIVVSDYMNCLLIGARTLAPLTVAVAIVGGTFFMVGLGRLSSTPAYRPNDGYQWSALAGIVHGFIATWPLWWAAVLWRHVAPQRPASPTVLGPTLLVWMGIATPALLGACTALCVRRFRPGCGRCPACGYDLRASSGRCPECGTPCPERTSEA